MPRRRHNGLSQAEKVRRVECPPTIGYGASAKTGCGAAVGEKCRDAKGVERDANHAARVKAHKIAYPAVESIHVGGGAARDHYGREHSAAPSGARFDAPCPRCDESLAIGGKRPVKTSRGWMHPQCAPGADDE